MQMPRTARRGLGVSMRLQRNFGLLLATVLITYGVVAPPVHAAPECFGKRATIVGTAGDDQLIGTPRADVLVGLRGDDQIIGRAGNDRICGGRGFDGIDFFQAGGRVVVNLTLGKARTPRGRDSVSSIELVRGSLFADVIIGNAKRNYLDGSGKDDRLRGKAGNDSLFGEDTVYGDLPAIGNDIMYGGDGDDSLTGDYNEEDGGDDLMHGGPGNDRLVGDVTAGFGGDDRLFGDDGNDELDGVGGGSDQLSGDDGDDLLMGARTTESFDGGAGTDEASFAFVGGTVAADLESGTAIVVTPNGQRSAQLVEIEWLEGGSSDDTLAGDEGANVLKGGDGNDQLSGRAGDDSLFGEAGNDDLDGGSDDDTLDGGDGTDSCLNGEAIVNCE